MKLSKAAYLKQWKIENAQREKENIRRWKKGHQDQEVDSQRKWRASNPNYQLNWSIENRAKRNAMEARYRAKKLKAIPKWLTKDNIREIEEFYTLAQELAWLNEDCRPLDVDHIVPLQGKNVSGLHVPWNLQLLPHKENCYKKNKEFYGCNN